MMETVKIIKQTMYVWRCPFCNNREAMRFNPCQSAPYRLGRQVVCPECDTGYMISPDGKLPSQEGIEL
jgi:hypothetical protein